MNSIGLNADVANDVNADFAIYQFWMEVVPPLLQLNGDKDAAAKLPGLQDVRNALEYLAACRS